MRLSGRGRGRGRADLGWLLMWCLGQQQQQQEEEEEEEEDVFTEVVTYLGNPQTFFDHRKSIDVPPDH